MPNSDAIQEVENLTLQEQVYLGLRQDIMLGRFRPGKSVTIRGLAETLGTSPMPIREALRRLVAERALQLLPNRRVTVPKMTAERYKELTDARIAMEPLAARRALRHITKAELEKLRAIDREIDQTVIDCDIETYLIKNKEFHFTLYAYGASEVIMPIIESLWLQIGPFLKMAMERHGLGTVEDQHHNAMDAIAAQDADALEKAIRLDILDGVSRLPDDEFDQDM